MAQYYDNAVKYVMLGYSQEFAEFMVGRSNIKVLENLETEQPTIKSHQNDSTLKVQLENETVIFHTEVQTDDSRKPMWSRLAGYNGFLIHQHEMPVYCNVLYLHPNAGRNDKGFYAYKGMGYEYVLRYNRELDKLIDREKRENNLKRIRPNINNILIPANAKYYRSSTGINIPLI